MLETVRNLQRDAAVRVSYLPVDDAGLVTPADLAAAITPETSLVSIMFANGETGTIQPVAELASIAHAHGALFHTDAAQAVGKIPVSVQDLGIDLLSVAGHKMYAPKGVGALYVRAGIELRPVLPGGGQEGGIRSSTENVAGIVGLGVAAALAADSVAADQIRLAALRDRLLRRLQEQVPGGVMLNGHPQNRLPNTLNVSFVGVTGAAVLSRAHEVAASTRAACHSGQTDPSPVLAAMSIPFERALAAVRLSLGRWTTEEDVEMAARALAKSIIHERNADSLPGAVAEASRQPAEERQYKHVDLRRSPSRGHRRRPVRDANE